YWPKRAVNWSWQGIAWAVTLRPQGRRRQGVYLLIRLLGPCTRPISRQIKSTALVITAAKTSIASYVTGLPLETEIFIRPCRLYFPISLRQTTLMRSMLI